MRKINKIVNIALIFTLIGVFCADASYALRLPLHGTSLVEESIEVMEELKSDDIRSDGEAIDYFKETIELLKKVRYIDFDGIPYDELVVFLTKYCPVGCEGCLFNSPLPTAKSRPEHVLSWEGIEKVIQYTKDMFPKWLTVTGGGEGWLESEKLLYLIKNAHTENFCFISSGYWAKETQDVERVLSEINSAVEENEDLHKLRLEISVDVLHQKKIPLDYVINIVTVLSENSSRFPNIELTLRGLRASIKDGLEPIEELLAQLPVKKQEDNSDFPLQLPLERYSDREVRLENGFRFKVQYNALTLTDPYKLEGIKYEKYSQIKLLKYKCIELGMCGNARRNIIDYSGNVVIDDVTFQIPSGNIYKDSFNQIRERENHNPFIRVLRTEGIGYVLDIALEVEPKLIKRIDKYNNPDGAIIEIMQNPKLLYYVVKRLIQEDIRSDLIDIQSLNGNGLVLTTKKDLQLEYYKISKKKIPLQHKKAEQDKTVVLTIIPNPHRFEYISEVSETLFSNKDYECYVEQWQADAIGRVEDEKPDIIMVPFRWESFNIKRFLQKARLANSNLQIIMYYDDYYRFSRPTLKRERQYFRKLKNISFVGYHSYYSSGFVEDGYVREIQEARQRIAEQETFRLKNIIRNAGENRNQS